MPAAGLCLFLLGVLIPLLWPTSATLGQGTDVPAQSALPAASSDGSMSTAQVGVPVYYVNTRNHLLYREVHTLPTQQDALVTAVNAVLKLVPSTPAFQSVWKGGTVLSVEQRGASVRVNLSGDSYAVFRDRASALQAASQIYYTVNAVLGTADAPVPVVLLDDNEPDVPQLGDTSVDGFWDQAPMVGPASIDRPAEGATLARGDVELSGVLPAGGSWVRLSVVDARTGEQVGTSTSTVVDGQSAARSSRWSQTVHLGPGRYRATLSGGGADDSVVFQVT